MNNKSITPNPQQPVDRVPTGQLPSALAELSEAALNETNGTVNVQIWLNLADGTELDGTTIGYCSYDGDDE